MKRTLKQWERWVVDNKYPITNVIWDIIRDWKEHDIEKDKKLLLEQSEFIKEVRGFKELLEMYNPNLKEAGRDESD
jgi:hypothetical protein